MNAELQTRITALLESTIQDSSGRDVTLEAETPLLDSGYLDSLTLLRVLVELQEAFGVELDVGDLTEESFATPQAVAELVEARL
ncbi:MAG: phosphopantetheine-binding protein [Myxococcota bacterium]